MLLAYRLPRVPSTPRSAVWRKLKRLGVAWLGDGLMALPADPRTREQLEWIAEDVTDHGGEAILWLGRPLGASAISAVVRGGQWRGCAANCNASRAATFFTCPQREAARRAVESQRGTTCFTGPVIPGCLGSDADFDGFPYHADWPNSDAAPSRHPTSSHHRTA